MCFDAAFGFCVFYKTRWYQLERLIEDLEFVEDILQRARRLHFLGLHLGEFVRFGISYELGETLATSLLRACHGAHLRQLDLSMVNVPELVLLEALTK